MGMFTRYFDDLGHFMKRGKVLILYGPRRTGKTTLLEHFLGQSNLRYRLDTGDDIRIQELLGSGDLRRILEYTENYELLAIDEAQLIPKIGQALKIIVDHRPNLHVIATGSSSFDLSQTIGEPLTGRKRTLTLYPIAQLELLNHFTPFELKERLEEFLIFGQYPEIVSTQNRRDKIELLEELVDSYLLKNILLLDRIKNPEVLLNLVKLLAFQVGQLVSHHELATQLGLDVKTINRYLDLLEKSFVICKLGGFSRNLRKEITRKHKYYFLDNGVRNGVIRHFNPFNTRNDIGQLWENFLMMERLKKRSYERFYGNTYFWRTYEGQEIDLIEELDHHLSAFEMKWGEKSISPPKSWQKNYPEATFTLINSKNYLDWLTSKI